MCYPKNVERRGMVVYYGCGYRAPQWLLLSRDSQELLTRMPRQDHQPRHAAEVQENIVPSTYILLGAYSYLRAGPTPMEDCRVIKVGRYHPSRPEYEEVFGSTSITEPRHRAGNGLTSFLRNVVDDEVEVHEVYSHRNCPGIDCPDIQKNFPIIDTILSILFSLVHTLPCLSRNQYSSTTHYNGF